MQDKFDGVLARIIHSGQLNAFSGHIQIDASCEENKICFSAQAQEEPVHGTTLTFGEKLHENNKSAYLLHIERDTVLQMYKRVSKASYLTSINYSPYLLILKRKLIEYGFNKTDITELDNEICEKVEREISGDIPHQPKKKQKRVDTSDTQEIFHPFSIEEMRELMLQLWRSQVESTNKTFETHHTDFRLMLIQKAIRDTMIAFFGHTIRKDQSIWIGHEIHTLYLRAKASIQ